MTPHRDFVVPLPSGDSLMLGRHPLVMGILNVTPDSFSDGGEHDLPRAAVAHAQAMLEEGAHLVEIGGESTRPGAEPVSATAELARVLPIMDELRAASYPLPISIDTYKAEIAERAIQAGAMLINDVRGLQGEPEIADVAAAHKVPIVAMHWDIDRDVESDVISEIRRYFERAITVAANAGVPRDRLILDPGFGFAKSLAENYEILRRLPELQDLGYPLLVGTSRKSMIGRLLDAPVDRRLAGTIATSVIAYAAGAHIFRVHDVRQNRDALRVAEATFYGIDEAMSS